MVSPPLPLITLDKKSPWLPLTVNKPLAAMAPVLMLSAAVPPLITCPPPALIVSPRVNVVPEPVYDRVPCVAAPPSTTALAALPRFAAAARDGDGRGAERAPADGGRAGVSIGAAQGELAGAVLRKAASAGDLGAD